MLESDDLVFAADSLTGLVIQDDADDAGVRLPSQAVLKNARAPLQIDIGFGDIVVPDAAVKDHPRATSRCILNRITNCITRDCSDFVSRRVVASTSPHSSCDS